MITAIASFVAGLFLWTFFEYALHRFAFHEKWLGARMAREHGQHHARVDWFAPLIQRVALAVPIVSTVAAVSALLLGTDGGLVVMGLLGGWLFYEVLHRRIHTTGPLNGYGAWARRHHLAHHFGNPKKNHGVTTPLWDVVFGTLIAPDVVKVPARQGTKLGWLVEEVDGGARIAPAYAASYRLS
jgi:sterol desaturase/sphingolipid hydroxylase (fatty acid hydroxylase superfamily)